MLETKYIKTRISNLLPIHKIITVHYHEFSRNYRFEGEQHDFWELVYVDRGEVLITAGKIRYTLPQGSAVFHKPNEFHAIAANGEIAPNVFIITFVCRSKAMEYFKNRISRLTSRQRDIIADMMREARATFDIARFNPGMKKLSLREDAPVGGQQLIRIDLERLLIGIIRDAEQKNGRNGTNGVFISRRSHENHLIQQLLEIINESLYEELNLNDLCARMNYGKTALCTLFKSATGYGVMQYYNYQKIVRAKQMIREQSYNINQISNMLKYNTPQYFSRVFKQHTGMTPTEYAASIRAD